MKYIYYIGIAITLLSGIIFYNLAPRQQPDKKAAIIINGRTISEKEFNELSASSPAQFDERDTLINMIITKELLLQEAQKEGIHKEESFRKSVQDFYEQSLIKLLMDRKYASLHPAVSDEEVKDYYAVSNKKLSLTIFDANSPEEARKGIFKGEEKRVIGFSDLSGDLQYPLISLKEGVNSGPVRTGNRYVVLRIDKVEGEQAAVLALPETAVRKMLAEWKKEKMMNDWIDDLRARAMLKILIPEGGRK